MLMPVLFILLLVLCGVSLSLPNAGEGLRYFLQPDFSMITPSVFMNALGQAFFSLSLGMGILITYSAYFPKRDNLNSTAFTIAGCDFLVALLMGFIIFPAVTSFGLAGDSSLDGASLVFITLPEVFAQMPCTQLWSIIFFLLLFIAALTSTISISEVSVLFFQDTMRFSRKKAVLSVILPLFIFSPLCSLSQGVLSHVTIFSLTIFDLLDTVATNYMLPTAAFFTCIYAGWVLPKNFLRRELTNDGHVGVRLYPIIRFLVRYVAPLLILLIFIYQFV
jgi:NSS family neurotransmitter:Na+ symporter